MQNLTSISDAKILITGGAGMLGSTIADLAVQSGATVTIVDAMLPLYGGNQFNLANIQDKITFIEGDIRDQALMDELVEGQDFIFNLAAQVSYIDSNEKPIWDVDTNCRGHLTVLEACRKVNPDTKILFSSSRFVYGTIETTPVKEDHPFNCLSIYGIHKLAGEKYHRFYYDAYGIRTVTLRIANPYGPRQQMKHSKYGILNWFIRLALDGKPITVYGEGKQQRDYIFSEDFAEAAILAIVSPETDGNVYNVGSGTGIAFIDMVHAIVNSVPDSEVKILEWPQRRYFVETGDYISDITALQTVTGWQPRTSIIDGIRKTVDYYRQHHGYYWE